LDKEEPRSAHHHQEERAIGGLLGFFEEKRVGLAGLHILALFKQRVRSGKVHGCGQQDQREHDSVHFASAR
jgi:hypothetical protein